MLDGLFLVAFFFNLKIDYILTPLCIVQNRNHNCFKLEMKGVVHSRNRFHFHFSNFWFKLICDYPVDFQDRNVKVQ